MNSAEEASLKELNGLTFAQMQDQTTLSQAILAQHIDSQRSREVAKAKQRVDQLEDKMLQLHGKMQSLLAKVCDAYNDRPKASQEQLHRWMRELERLKQMKVNLEKQYHKEKPAYVALLGPASSAAMQAVVLETKAASADSA